MKIVIINTGCANLFSINTSIRRLGYCPIITDNFDIISQADKIFLPGVGSAQTAMRQLQQKQLISVLQNITQPILGICLGMQILAKYSEENKGTDTLGIINTTVKKMPYQGLSLPHIGWNKTSIKKNTHNLFYNIKNDSYFYFIHNYFIPLCAETIAITQYGIPFTAAITYHNFFGVQFHPEKSSSAGEQLIKNFLEM
ncbi:imidazole glycerol phosphate synthase subunit HisH [Blochmannia endosymbiont of Polyrhachis (Hedomyrma) turneri]|uniref:imidazole glycerol phosphate synthase subunit HisH n=1 Tax=Blochmannia endosymbiont of Polyrhachis (Hedomyrma) turneri TaxID=1505596 RepID=UPI00061A824E|nr:imidazole glycerol phosphate synthase subunit HisH [Blochmannia endosymbiont of Polyrhachis (Hedomyrma) turneri]AKC60028.1 Imidazole glycerol phosphate synthase subunit HisH [Blochmannia endosymbiont of Polyrhachis (Hedomyrma) turneri]